MDGPSGEKMFSLELAVVTESLVVVGTRASARSAPESSVPIDAIPSQDILRQGQPDVANRLRTVIPSFNVSAFPIADAATLVRPATLRNLAPEHTLVLVNGKRRHRSSIIVWQFGSSVGNHGPDISTIPSIALRQVEVLRDGASAQYGSDAIAGVINFQLKDARSGGSFEANAGTFGSVGGGGYSFATNVGMPLGEEGFANLSVEWGESDRTDVSVQRLDAAGLIEAGNSAVADPAQKWGSPSIDDDMKVFINLGHPVGGNTHVYGHGNYAQRKVIGNFFYRNPTDNEAVFGNGSQLLVGDLADARDGVPDGSGGCIDVPIEGGLPHPGALYSVHENPDCFAFALRFPGGFTPRFGGKVRDGSLVGGVRGASGGGFVWDLSAGFGTHQTDFMLDSTVNASLGPDSPTEFDPGLYRQEEFSVNFDTAYAVTERMNVAAGAEFRNERFIIGAGDPQSYQLGPLADQGFTSGSNGFPGFSDAWAGEWSRRSAAFYGDLEFRDPAGRWTFGAAGRYEHYQLFGGTLNGKVAGRYRFAPGIALRGSVSSGFRAPTVGQQFAQNVQTTLGPAGNLIDRGTIQSNSPIAQLKGGKPLTPEKALNYTFGAVMERGSFLFTADYFRINIDDRLTLTQDFVLTPEEISRAKADGIQGAETLTSFNFFTNDFSTVTQGVDLVAAWVPEGLGGDTEFSAAYNYTDTALIGESSLLGEGDIVAMENYVPRTRWNFGIKQGVGSRIDVLGRLNYYGSWIDYWDARLLGRGRAAQPFSGKPVLDFEVTVGLTRDTQLALGAQNVFGTVSDEYESAFTDIGGAPITMRFFGMPYSPFTPWGFNGTYYYARLRYSWGRSF